MLFTLVAVASAVTLVVLPAPSPQTAPVAPPTVQSTWPDAELSTFPALLDGGEYVLRAVTADGVPVGTVQDSRGGVRLLLGEPRDARELHQLPAPAEPGYSAVLVAGDQVVWATTVPDDAGVARSAIWAATLDGGSPARQLTADTGDLVLFNSQYDLVVAEGRVHWVSAAPAAEATTEVRSVPLTGGDVRVRRIPGAFALSAWPWLVSAGTGRTGAIELLDLLTGRRVPVAGRPDELIACGPAWCRVVVLGNEGSTRLDMVRRDGRDRHTVAEDDGAAISPALSDVALLDRFEVLTTAARDGEVSGDQRLLLYDTTTRRAVVVHEAAGATGARDGWLWWSTGTAETTRWHLLNLRSLA